MVGIDNPQKQNLFRVLNNRVCKGVLRPKTLGTCCSSRSWGRLVSESPPSRHCPHCLLPSPLPHPPAPHLGPPGVLTHAQMELSIGLSLPALSVSPSSRRECRCVSLAGHVWCGRDRGGRVGIPWPCAGPFGLQNWVCSCGCSGGGVSPAGLGPGLPNSHGQSAWAAVGCCQLAQLWINSSSLQ